MSTSRRVPLPSVADYLELEATSSYRHEYVDGHIFPVPDATVGHNGILVNVAAQLRQAVRGTVFRLFAIEVLLRVSPNRFYYPDVQIVRRDEPDAPFVTAPTVVVEIMSASTEQIDQREKLFAYKSIDTVKAYYIIRQDRMTVENHWRDDEGTWWHGTLHQQGKLRVPCLNVDLSLEDIYEGVTFDDD